MASESRKWAILVGIDFYVQRERCLSGAVNDVDMVQSYLASTFQFHSIARFTAVDRRDPTQTAPDGPENTWPTYQNLAKELKRVARTASPGDSVYFHYSGHGALSPTASPEYNEDFGSDAALVLFDRHNKNNARYLRGIELAGFLDRMVEKGLLLTVVLDCCHAGSLSRGNRTRVRSMPWDNNIASSHPPEVWRAQSPPGASAESEIRDATTSQHWLVRPKGYTLVAACGLNELAGECRGKDDRVHGALTYFLFKALFRASADKVQITLRDIYRQACAELHVPLPRQHPVLLGNPSSGFLRAEAQAESQHSACNVLDILPDDHVRLNVGLAQGVCVGDQYELYKLSRISQRTAQQSALYTITAVRAFESDAKQLRAPLDEVNVARGWHASLGRSSRPKAQVTLSSEISPRIRDLVDQSHWVELVDTIEVVSESLPCFHVCIAAKDRYVISFDGDKELPNLPLVPTATKDSQGKLLRMLEHLAKLASIERVGNEQPTLATTPPLDARAAPEGLTHKDARSDFGIEFESDGGLKMTVVGSTLVVVDGEKLRVRFKNLTSGPLYLTIINLRPLRAATKLYPSSDRGYYKEVPPKGARFKGEISFAMVMSIPESLKSQGVGEAEDVLKFFVATNPTCMSFAALELPELSDTMLAEGKRSDRHDALHQYFEDGMLAGRRRGGESEDENQRWTCHNFTVTTQLSGQ